ncbi:MAG: tRNA (adenosine(37)-N6)-threonylcarbamoyltransferase complex dimerization subunit type 1 TsaB [Eubacterium sp.]|jgi:tRNA threonylcarbamoyladenosine biosynthesis protein TsaB|nr:tRNA (adenosine(37)-N6)-threonylcarbamoyltransferase complex dimerization subunit type 1 TsaB [Eubacterium sp.]
MIVLGIDSSSSAVSAAICDVSDGKVLAGGYLNVKTVHSKTLMPMLESMLSAAEINLSDIGIIAVAAGPGSFTGLRIGLSAAKGLGYALNKPIRAVSTLYSLAANLAGLNGIVCPVLDARRGQFYNALFRIENGKITRLCEDRAATGEEITWQLRDEYKMERIILNGDGAQILKGLATDQNIEIAPPALQYQNAVSVCLSEEGEVKPANEIIPDYLRPVRFGGE